MSACCGPSLEVWLSNQYRGYQIELSAYNVREFSQINC